MGAVPLLEKSRAALAVFHDKMKTLLRLLESPTSNSASVFHDYLFRYIKPIALDFRVALDVVTPKTDEQQNLSQMLQEFQNNMLSIQTFFRGPEAKKLDNLRHVSQLTQDIVELISQHLEHCPFLS